MAGHAEDDSSKEKPSRQSLSAKIFGSRSKSKSRDPSPKPSSSRLSAEDGAKPLPAAPGGESPAAARPSSLAIPHSSTALPGPHSPIAAARPSTATSHRSHLSQQSSSGGAAVSQSPVRSARAPSPPEKDASRGLEASSPTRALATAGLTQTWAAMMPASSAGPPPPPQSHQQQMMMPPQYAQQPPPQQFKTFFGCLSLNMQDRIRLVNFRPEDHQAVCSAVQSVWPEGIQALRPYGMSQEIKCNGYPWMMDVNGYDEARRLVLRLVHVLFDKGWVLMGAIDISKKERDKDSLFFRFQHPAPPPCDWIAVSFDGTDKLKVVGDLPPDLAQALVQAYANLVASHEHHGDRLKIHFKHYPWHAQGEETVLTRQMILTLFECLERFGFSVLSSVDMSSGVEGRDCDVLFCNRDKTWKHGDPIWHR